MSQYGIQSMLKEGHKHLSGLDEAVVKNIDACKQLSTITRTSLGPNGMNKMVINHLDKLFVTNDAATIVNELEVQHPAAKLLVLAGKAQQEEIGDGANLTISFSGELLSKAEELIRMGLHPSEIISGYTKAIKKTIEILDDLVEEGSENMDVRSKEEVVKRLKAPVASKQFGQEEILSSLVADACIQVCPKNPANFNVDNVRVAKFLGGGLHNCTVVRGMVLKTDALGSIKQAQRAKVAVFAGGVDTSATETKGTVLIHTAEQLERWQLHFCERYKIMVLKISSKFELRRFCRTVGAVAMLKLCQPNPDDLGYVDSISVEEIAGVRVTIVKNEEGVDDGVNTYKAMCRDSQTGLDHRETKVALNWWEAFAKTRQTLQVWDLHVTKFFALKYAADAACTVLRVDQIIMAKPAGGPRRGDQPAGMDED
ncbi:hypothetical protein M0R45_008802 [Rubus argutus]|uniref:CCT-theta n=1 Tax=Rubus argutus TaxID=59490 RepID=A0AAW1Y4S7_RUBAR